MLSVYRRELRSAFASPLAWTILAAGQFIAAYLFFIQLEDFLLQQETLRSAPRPIGLTEFVLPRFFAPLSAVLMLMMPLLSMRMIAGERTSGTLALLLSAPVGGTQIVAGKFLAALSLATALIVMIGAMPMSLAFWIEIDISATALALLGVWLACAVGLAFGLLASTLTRQPASAAMLSASVLLLLWMIGGGGARDAELTWLTRYLSIPHHLQAMFNGVLDTRDVGFFVALTLLCLALCTLHLMSVRHVR